MYFLPFFVDFMICPGFICRIVTEKKMAVPTDMKLYNAVKKAVYRRIKTHSAYRSGILVKRYKERFAAKYGKKRKPYKGSKRPLKRWFEEQWRSDTGRKVYTSKSSVFRPTRRVSRATPKTFAEIGARRLQRAKSEKSRTGRVKKF